MATDPYWQLEKEYSTVADDADLIVKAVQYEQVKRTENGSTVMDSAPCKVHEYRVKRETLSGASPVLRKLLTAGFRETEQTTIELNEDNAAALETWLKIMHVNSPTLDNVTFAYLDTDIKGVWEVLSTAHKYEIDPKDARAKAWFEKWYAAQMNRDGHRFGYLDFQALIFPCYTFNHAVGFTYATKQLVYRSNGHIAERQPAGFRQDNLHLTSNIIQQLNAAKSRLKTILHRELYNPIDALLKRARCPCKPFVLFGWEQALANTGAWPLETAFARTNVNDILRQLETFRAFQPQSCGLPWCNFDFAETVRRAVEKTRTYFDGLCLDCIDSSHPKLGNADEDYWHHAARNVSWDEGCRVRHKQPSWFFSFMGRRQKMVQWTKAQKNGSFRPRGGYAQGAEPGEGAEGYE